MSRMKFAAALLALSAFSVRAADYTVLQWNIWQEGTMVEGGYDAIVNEIVRLQPDFVTLSEVRNYRGVDFTGRLAGEISARGVVY